MNLRRLFCLSGLLLSSAMGCCHSSMCVNSDPCDSCGCSQGGGRYASNSFSRKIDSWRHRNHCRNYGWNDVGCGCDACGMGVEDGMMSSGCASGNCGGAMSSGSPTGCACGQHHGEYAPSMPGSMVPSVAPSAAPTPIPAAPPVGNEPAPAPIDNPSTAIPRSLSTQPQQVSVEEFQRLPGVIVAGPSASSSSVPSMAASVGAAQPVMAAPQLSSVPAAPRVLPGAQQVNWVPSKQ